MATKNQHPLKRTLSQSDMESLNVNQKKINKNDIAYNTTLHNNSKNDTIPWPKFLVIKQNKDEENKSLDKLSHFAVNKTIISLGGEPKSVKKLFSGDILVETQNKSQTSKLLKTTLFLNIPVTVSPHRSLNFSKGVIRSRELKDCSEDELLTELGNQGITAVKKITVTRDGKKISTGTIILTFNTPEPPKAIKAAYLYIKVETYVPNPLRCFKCQKFGHHQATCKREAACGRCGEANHDDTGCKNTPCCINCSGSHASYSRECPTYILERKIITYKINNNTSFPEARKIVTSCNSPTSYAKIAASNTKKDSTSQTATAINTKKEVSTQTDLVCHVWTKIWTTASASQTDSLEASPIESNTNNNLTKNNNAKLKSNGKSSTKHKLERNKESGIPTPCTNLNVKTKIKSYERVIKPPTPIQLRKSTESIDFPPMDVIRSAAEAQETSDDDMEVVVSQKSKRKGKASKKPILPPS
ncbi:Nucleic-acid-binding protein from mobile element jockey [Nymphon striatum]|nr:Nucleic-acid-binding protein from mobile element jockey [Nymphon striatum]